MEKSEKKMNDVPESIIEHIMIKHGFCHNDGNITALLEFEALVKQDATKNIRAVYNEYKDTIFTRASGSRYISPSEFALWEAITADVGEK